MSQACVRLMAGELLDKLLWIQVTLTGSSTNHFVAEHGKSCAQRSAAR